MDSANLEDLKKRMNGALEALSREFIGLRTSRASAALLEPLMVEAYEGKMPLPQVGTISVPEARLITVQVWDKGLLKNVEKAIRDAGLGLNPMSEGQLIRVPIPDLSQERRQEIAKIAGKYAEQARVSVRNIRRDGMELLKKEEKGGEISEDEHHRLSEEIQSLTDEYIKKIDQHLAQKEKDLLQV